MKDVKKLQVIMTQEIVYTFAHWETKEVDGVEFVAVAKFEPKQNLTQQMYWMRKDSLKPVK